MHINKHDFNKQKVAVLYAIKLQYKQILADDPVLKLDFNRLQKYVRLFHPHSAERCTKIINHLLAEISEDIEDNQRMDDESPLYQKNKSVSYNKPEDYLSLKHALEEYHGTYLSEKTKE